MRNQIDRIVAENCDEYTDRLYMCSNRLTYSCNTCSRCVNYENGMCSKNKFNVIRDIISMN